jgi:RimJ/RimL family protein N-acetyltransferase
VKGPERIATARLVLRRPRASDAEAIFARYASDPEVTRYMGWPRHESLADTRAFLAFSDELWQAWPAGPYLVESADGVLLGSTGFLFETPYRAETGYVLAKQAWGRGYATEALQGVVDLSGGLGLRRLEARCHAEHERAFRVLERCGFVREGRLRAYSIFPNLGPDRPCDVFSYARVFE